MLVSIIQIYPLKAPVGSGCHQILGWDGNKWNRYTRTGKTWEYALPAGKVQKLIFWFQTLCTYVSHILYSVRCSNFQRLSKRPISPQVGVFVVGGGGNGDPNCCGGARFCNYCFVVDASICFCFFVDIAFIVVFAEVEQGCVR